MRNGNGGAMSCMLSFHCWGWFDCGCALRRPVPRRSSRWVGWTRLIRCERRIAAEIMHESVKRRFVAVVVFPIAEVWDEVLAYLARGVLTCVGVEAFPLPYRVVGH